MKKSKTKNIAPERYKVTKYCTKQQLRAIMNPEVDAADPADPDYQVSEPVARALPSTRAGGQDDGS